MLKSNKTLYAYLLILALLSGCATSPKPNPAYDLSGLDNSTISISSNRQRIVGIAESLLGVPYQWGGNDRNGVDCSGLVKYAFSKLGINMPRTAEKQYLSGRKLKRVQPGDLLFYKTSPGRISHVGIYVGDGQMIHASTSRKRVIRANINKAYWRKRLVGGATYLACAGPNC